MPGPYFAAGRLSTRSPALNSRRLGGLHTQLNTRTTLGLKPQAEESPSDKREIASLKNVVDELTNELQQKNEELQKYEIEFQTLRAELENKNFELLEYSSLINSLGVGNQGSRIFY
jgi:uncharacterized protein (DUF3084 family)